MEKAELNIIIDMPVNCYDCQFLDDVIFTKSYDAEYKEIVHWCDVLQKSLGNIKERDKDCPLKPLREVNNAR